MVSRISRFCSTMFNSVQRHFILSPSSNLFIDVMKLVLKRQQNKLSNSLAGLRRYTPAYKEEMSQHDTDSMVRSHELLIKMTHWKILMEREHGEPPKAELTLSIRRKILELEHLIAPEFEDPKNVLDDYIELPPPDSYELYPLYTKMKWLQILQKRDHPIVQQLIELMETANVPQDEFCQALGKLSVLPADDYHLYARKLTEFKLEEILEHCLHRYFNEETHPNPELAIKSITDVLMKV